MYSAYHIQSNSERSFFSWKRISKILCLLAKS